MIKPQGTKYKHLYLAGGSQDYVHILVCEAFHGPKPNWADCVRHLNGDFSDNRAENLSWGTWIEQSEDRKKHGTFHEGASAPWSKVSDQDVREIRDLACNRTFPQGTIGKLYGISQQQVSRIRTGVNHRSGVDS